ncbi:MAG: hypothetical protein NC123_12715 [Butyrivibrio sp.]|nr:hypothetical protein [Acetatifactor muris]MCM1560382.1 hypothetical protein [Butyrivibrio sp.]
MSKLVKGLLAVGVSVAVAAMSCVPVLAAYTCDACGKGTIIKSSSPSGWSYLGTTDCEKVSGQRDPVFVNVITITEECNYCHVVYKYNQTKLEARCSH